MEEKKCSFEIGQATQARTFPIYPQSNGNKERQADRLEQKEGRISLFDLSLSSSLFLHCSFRPSLVSPDPERRLQFDRDEKV